MKKIAEKITKYCAILVLIFGMVACAEEDERTGLGDEMQVGEGELNIPFEVDGEMPLARGVVSQSHETRLGQVYLMFFDTESEDMLMAYKSVTVAAGKRVFSFDPPAGLATDRDYRVLAIGNADSYAGETAFKTLFDKWILEGWKIDEVAHELTTNFSGPLTFDSPGRLPMWGKYMKDGSEAMFNFTRDGEGNASVPSAIEAVFRFSRAVCRVDIHNLVGHVLDIRCARLVNYNTHGYFFYENIDEPTLYEFKPETAPGGAGYKPITVDMVEGENTTQRLEGSLYCFPNLVGTSVVNDTRTTALMIAGYYTDPETGEKDEDLTYYRFNLANAGDAQLLQRNYCYRATIKGVKHRGESDESSAYNSSTPVFEYDIDDEWDITDENFVSDKDGNFLAVNRSHFTFQGEASEADYMEIRVSTNPGLSWSLEWVDTQGNSNSYFTAKRISDSAITCGPRMQNHTDYVRYGYLKIVATNPVTGATLSIPIYLMQLSTVANVKTLTVNGNTGTFTQELNPMGGSVSFEVVTGSVANEWVAEDFGNQLTNWDTRGVSFTEKGNNRTVLEITVPANMTREKRTATIVVSLKDNDTNEDGSKLIKDVTINLVQDPSPSLLDVLGQPSTGALDIQCFSTDHSNPNGVVNQHSFTVKLADARLRYKVTSTFDKYRDLVLSANIHRGVGSSEPAVATHPAIGTVVNNDELADLSGDTQFWINPFRTGLNDPMITGTITVTAYSVSPDLEVTPESRSFTVRLMSEKVRIDDVFLKNSSGYFMLPDRNYAATERIATDDTEVEAGYYDSRQSMRITGLTKHPYENVGFCGQIIRMQHHNENSPTIDLVDHDGHPHPMPTPTMLDAYKEQRRKNNSIASTINYVWPIDKDKYSNVIINAGCWSKQRLYIVSNFKTTDDKFVCCWMPHYDCYVQHHGSIWYGSAYYTDIPHASNFMLHIVYLANTDSNNFVYCDWVDNYTQRPTTGTSLLLARPMGDLTGITNAQIAAVYDVVVP